MAAVERERRASDDFIQYWRERQAREFESMRQQWKQQWRERREKRAPVADNVCAPNGTALETAAPADGAALDTDLDTYFDGAKEEAAPAAGDDVMAA